MDNLAMSATVEDMRAAFGLADDVQDAGTTETTEAETVETTTKETPETVEETTEGEAEAPEAPQETPETPSAPQQPDFSQKQNQAFARMRTENSQMQKTISAMAQILGIDPKLPADQLNAQLQAQARNALAKQNNMDPKILERLEYLEEINNRYVQSQNELKAQNAFQNIKSKYAATDDDLKVFVNDLIRDGFDITTGDIEAAFIQRNFETILERKTAAAVQAEQQRASKASGASIPAKKQGQVDSSDPAEIKSVNDLDAFLSNLK